MADVTPPTKPKRRRGKEPSDHHERTPKAAERVAAQLRAQIVTGDLRPNDKLLSQSALQQQFGVSRPTLREALRLLEAESLIHISRGQHGGAFVTALDPRITAKQVGVFLQMSGTTLRDIWQARTALEPFAAKLVAERNDPAVIDALQQTLEACRAAIDDSSEYKRLTAEFSTILCRSCGNKTIELFAFLIREIVVREAVGVTLPAFVTANLHKMRTESLESRSRFIDILKTGTPEDAEAHWKTHIELVFSSLSAYRAQLPINVL